MNQAVLVVDMCGFSKLMGKQGRPAAKAAVHRLREIGTAMVEAQGGRVVNAFADNLFCVVPSVAGAMRAAEAIHVLVPISAGIGWGPVEIEGLDIWGDEMNLASDLGEVVAQCGQFLLTDAATRASR